MKWILVLSILFSFSVFGCGMRGPAMSPEAEKVRTATNTESCDFIKSAYLESRSQLAHKYLQRNTHNAGGDSYKIISSTPTRLMGADVLMISYEIYKCRK